MEGGECFGSSEQRPTGAMTRCARHASLSLGAIRARDKPPSSSSRILAIQARPAKRIRHSALRPAPKREFELAALACASPRRVARATLPISRILTMVPHATFGSLHGGFRGWSETFQASGYVFDQEQQKSKSPPNQLTVGRGTLGCVSYSNGLPGPPAPLSPSNQGGSVILVVPH